MEILCHSWLFFSQICHAVYKIPVLPLCESQDKRIWDIGKKCSFWVESLYIRGSETSHYVICLENPWTYLWATTLTSKSTQNTKSADNMMNKSLYRSRLIAPCGKLLCIIFTQLKLLAWARAVSWSAASLHAVFPVGTHLNNLLINRWAEACMWKC